VYRILYEVVDVDWEDDVKEVEMKDVKGGDKVSYGGIL
jgi:hypothetical protein